MKREYRWHFRYLLAALVILILLKMFQQILERGSDNFYAKLGEGLLNRLDDVTFWIMATGFFAFWKLLASLLRVRSAGEFLWKYFGDFSKSAERRHILVWRLGIPLVLIASYFGAMYSTGGLWWEKSAHIPSDATVRLAIFDGMGYTVGFLVAVYIFLYYACIQIIAEAAFHINEQHKALSQTNDPREGLLEVQCVAAEGIVNSSISYIPLSVAIYFAFWWPFKAIWFQLDSIAAFHKLMKDGGGFGAVTMSFIIYWIPCVVAGVTFAGKVTAHIDFSLKPMPLKLPFPLPWFEAKPRRRPLNPLKPVTTVSQGEKEKQRQAAPLNDDAKSFR